jgi:hypothetical protein
LLLVVVLKHRLQCRILNRFLPQLSSLHRIK